MLINLSGEDKEILSLLTTDEKFVESIFQRITFPKEPNADLFAMLLANMTKSDDAAKQLLTLSRPPATTLSKSPLAIDQLLDLFVKGADGSYNKDANFDYLCYVFADLSKFEEGRKNFLTPRKEGDDDDAVVPLSKLVVFTEHKSTIRRRGVASTIKNACFDTDAHAKLLSRDEAAGGVNLIPYILLPLMGPEEYPDEDTEGMPDELQLLDPDKAREPEFDIVKIHLETLLLLTTTREGRDLLREVKVYPIVRELHLHVEDDEVREGCDRFVQVIMRDEEGEETEMPKMHELSSVEDKKVDDDDDDDDELVEVA